MVALTLFNITRMLHFLHLFQKMCNQLTIYSGAFSLKDFFQNNKKLLYNFTHFV